MLQDTLSIFYFVIYPGILAVFYWLYPNAGFNEFAIIILGIACTEIFSVSRIFIITADSAFRSNRKFKNKEEFYTRMERESIRSDFMLENLKIIESKVCNKNQKDKEL